MKVRAWPRAVGRANETDQRLEYEMQDQAAKGLRTIIIGAGMAGLLAAIRLKQRGETNFAIYEKGASVGGTWRENTYPGIACDTPAHSYSYSFAFNPEWSAFYAPGPEIKRYFEDTAKSYGIEEHIHFNTEIEHCEWRDGQWLVRTKAGETDCAQVLVAATGVLHHPSIPDIPGLHDFARPWFHSARWDHSVQVEGKRIGVIGNGSTGVQIVSALARHLARLVHFQRSPQWIMPCARNSYSDAEKQAFRQDASLIEEVRDGPDAAARKARFTAAIIDSASPELAEIQDAVERNLEDSIRDPELREKLRPNYRAACKRLVFSAHYYDAVQEPAVYVETGAIERIEATGVRMMDGTFHELDVLVLATGFKVDQFVRPIKFIGEDGLDLDDVLGPASAGLLCRDDPAFSKPVPAQRPDRPGRQFLTGRYCRKAVGIFRSADQSGPRRPGLGHRAESRGAGKL